MGTRRPFALLWHALPVIVGCGVLVGMGSPARPAEPTTGAPVTWVRPGARPVGFPALPQRSPAGGAVAPATASVVPAVESVTPVAGTVVPAAEIALPPLPLPYPPFTDLPELELPVLQPDAKLPPDAPPAPKAFPVPPAASRLDNLGGPVGGPPKLTPEIRARFDKYLEQVVDPQNTLDLVVNRNRLLRFKDPPARIQVTDEAVAAMTVVSPRELSFTGKRVGTTVLTLWFGDPKEPARQDVLSYLVRVSPDPEFKDRLERVYEALAGEINRAFPDSAVKLQLVGDKLVVSGQAKDIYEAYQILRVVRANAPQGTPAATIPVGQVNVTVPAEAVAGEADVTGASGLSNFLLAGGQNVVNLLRVGGEHQVMLKVTVAEVNRAAARSVGINFDIARKDGLLVFAQRTGSLISGQLGGGGGGGGGGMSQVGTNLFALFSGGQVAAAVQALRTLNLAKSLAEPTLTTMNGRPASFQSGGQFPVPVVTGFTAAGLQGVTFVPFGVQLNFTPVVTDDDRVRLTVNAEVSTRDLSTSTNIGGASVPSLNSRNFRTTVELRAGETLAVAGLVQNNFGSDATRVPFLGDVPVVGRLFASDRTATADQELVILITPYLVHPLGKGECKPLPGSDLAPPTDCEFYLLGRLQNYGPAGDPSFAGRRRRCEQQMLVGPVGYTDGK